MLASGGFWRFTAFRFRNSRQRIRLQPRRREKQFLDTRNIAAELQGRGLYPSVKHNR
jgi:hypothetical protein